MLLADKVLIFDQTLHMLHEMPPDRECIERTLHKISQTLNEQEAVAQAQIFAVPVAT